MAIFIGNSLQRTIPYKDFFLYDEGGLLFRLRHLLITGLFLVLIVLFFLVYCRVYSLYCGGGAKNDASGSDEASQSKTKKPGKKKEEETKTATVTPTLTTATSSKGGGGGSSGKGVTTTTTTKTPTITPGKTSAPSSSSSSGKGTAPKAAPAAKTTAAGTVSMKEKAAVMKKVAKGSK